MPERKYEEILQELEDAGVSSNHIAELQRFNGSALRQERDQAKKDAEDAVTQAQRYRSFALTGQFEKLGVKVKPDALNIPTDLDPLDDEKVRDWAVGMGLAEPPPPAVPAEDQQGHQALVDASAGATGTPRHDARQSVLEAGSEEEFWARARAGGFSK